MRPVVVFGAGAFGTALAVTWARAGREVSLWGRDMNSLAAMARDRENTTRLPGVPFPDNLAPVSGSEPLPDGAILVLATPAQTTEAMIRHIAALRADGPVVLAAKGIDRDTGCLLSEIAGAALGDTRIGVLSGPGFAGEIARGLPTALTIAADDPALAETLQHALSTDDFRLYRSNDPIGVQLGGALKNVVAIACGIAIGAGLGESARAALMTRGFAEIARLGVAMGARAETLTGLSGLGDLSLTCGSAKSRNFARGLEIGRGEAAAEGVTVEGIATAEAVLQLGQRHGVDLPVAKATQEVLTGALDLRAAMKSLLSRPLRAEG